MDLTVRRARNFIWIAGAVSAICLPAAAAGQALTREPTGRASGVEAIKLPGFRAPAWGRWLPPEADASGVPLGGLGAGFVEIRPDGRIHDARFGGLGPWDRSCSVRLEVSTGGSPSKALISRKGAAGPAARPARYFGHYPIADMDFGRPTSAPVSVWCRAFSPFVPADITLSSMPVVLFRVRLKNVSGAGQRVSVRLSREEPGSIEEFQWRAREILGLMTKPDDGETFAIAGRGAGWVIRAPEPRSTGGPAIEFTGLVPGKGEAWFTLALAWHISAETDGAGKAHSPRYARKYADAGAVARDALARAEAIEAAIITWQEKIYSAEVPAWLKDALVNSLSLAPRNTFLSEEALHLVERQGNVVDSVGSRVDGSLPLLRMFPELEKEALRRLAARQAENGEVPGRLGLEGALGAPAFGPGRTLASAEFALLCRRAAHLTGDVAFAREAYPAVKRAMQFAMTLDTDSDGLINEPVLPKGLAWLDRHRRDWLWHGTSAYTACVGLAALRAAEEMAKQAGDEDFAAWCRDRYEAGRGSFEENLWTGSGYRLYTDPDGFRQSDTLFLAALTGQAIAWQCGLGDILDRRRVEDTLTTMAKALESTGDREAPSGLTPEGRRDDSGAPYSNGTVPRDVWLYAASAALAAEKLSRPELAARAIALAERAYWALVLLTSWRQNSLYRAGDLEPGGDPCYFGNLAVWWLADALGAKVFGETVLSR